jgi:hypothetical protein
MESFLPNSSRFAPLSGVVTFCLLALVAVSTWYPLDRKAAPASDFSVSESRARELLPPGLRLQAASDSACPWVGVDEAGEIRWKAVLSERANPEIRGYAGTISLLVGVRLPGTISGVRILAHQETPSFVKGIDEPWFLRQFEGKTIQDSLVPFQDLDGITHATVSVEAICAGVRAGLHVAMNSKGVEAPQAGLWPRKELIVLFLALLICGFERRLPEWLPPLMIGGGLGFMVPLFFSLAHVPTLLAFQGVPFFLGVYWAVVGLLVLGFPRGYCLKLCPMGRLQDLFWLLGKRAGSTDETANESAISLGRLILWGFLLTSAFGDWIPGERLEVFAALFLRNQGWFGALLVVAVVVGALVLKRFYCRHLCPHNALFQDIEYAKTRFGVYSAGNQGNGY